MSIRTGSSIIWIGLSITLACSATTNKPNLDSGQDRPNEITGAPHETKPTMVGSVDIEGVGEFTFNATEVATVRPDLFQPGYFSLFDVLVHLADKGEFDLEYHFDETMDTHLIDGLNGVANYWYSVWYDGGWSEASVHRMDYYPVKDRMHIAFAEVDRQLIERRHEIWTTEVARRKDNGAVIIDQVTIRTDDRSLEFTDVEVQAHDLRTDFFVTGTITASDIILSLADQGELSYELRWFGHIGKAVIGNYYVQRINDATATGMCGFVYEVGELDGKRGHHIHVQTDIRILQNPEYALFYWIELGPC